MAKKKLGRGFSDLMGISNENFPNNENYIEECPINKIFANKNQVRKKFSEEKLMELANSIKKSGVIQAILVRKIDDNYQIIAGERRYRAAKIAGLENIPVIIKDLDDNEVFFISLIENIQRNELSPLEEALAYKKILNDFNLTQETLSKDIGKSRASISNIMRVLTLPEEVQEKINEKLISLGHAKVLLSVKDEKLILNLAKRIIEENLTVRNLENIIKNLNKKHVKKIKFNQKEDNLLLKLKERYNVKVKISKNKNKNKLTIEYKNDEEFKKIYKILLGEHHEEK